MTDILIYLMIIAGKRVPIKIQIGCSSEIKYFTWKIDIFDSFAHAKNVAMLITTERYKHFHTLSSCDLHCWLKTSDSSSLINELKQSSCLSLIISTINSTVHFIIISKHVCCEYRSQNYIIAGNSSNKVPFWGKCLQIRCQFSLKLSQIM